MCKRVNKTFLRSKIFCEDGWPYQKNIKFHRPLGRRIFESPNHNTLSSRRAPGPEGPGIFISQETDKKQDPSGLHPFGMTYTLDAYGLRLFGMTHTLVDCGTHPFGMTNTLDACGTHPFQDVLQ